ncbi:MAG: outer membrane beta-barrel protein [Gemmatimonadetes bacterium]|nr:outer membrane beta-barrel protein [Gemmatimonadota bacterium]
MLALAVFAPATLRAQGFWEQFSYEGLRLSGIGVEMGGVVSDRLTAEPSPALRVDYGVLAPRLRVMFGASYFRGEFNQDEITRFAQRLRRVVRDPTGDFVIDVGSITWSQLEIDGDLQYLFPADRVRTYLGLGIGVHVRDGDGTAIEGTFVEDALDTIAAGVNLSTGVEVALVAHLAATVDLRGALTSELRLASARGGLVYRFPAPAPR